MSGLLAACQEGAAQALMAHAVWQARLQLLGGTSCYSCAVTSGVEIRFCLCLWIASRQGNCPEHATQANRASRVPNLDMPTLRDITFAEHRCAAPNASHRNLVRHPVIYLWLQAAAIVHRSKLSTSPRDQVGNRDLLYTCIQLDAYRLLRYFTFKDVSRAAVRPKTGTYRGNVLKLASCCRHFVNSQGLSQP